MQIYTVLKICRLNLQICRFNFRLATFIHWFQTLPLVGNLSRFFFGYSLNIELHGCEKKTCIWQLMLIGILTVDTIWHATFLVWKVTGQSHSVVRTNHFTDIYLQNSVKSFREKRTAWKPKLMELVEISVWIIQFYNDNWNTFVLSIIWCSFKFNSFDCLCLQLLLFSVYIIIWWQYWSKSQLIVFAIQSCYGTLTSSL